MRRREFIAGIGSAAAWPLAARAQQGERVRRVGVLLTFDENDRGGRADLSAFTKRLGELGWTEGRNLRTDIRWAAANIDRMQMFAKELVELRPDVIVTHTTPVTSALHRQTRTIPMVFVNVSDPVGAGFVAGLPHPGGNITGFSNLEASMGGKWVELLIEIAPAVKRAGLIFNPDNGQTPASYYLPSFEAAARSLKVAPISAPVHTDADIEAVITELGHEPQGGLVVMADGGFNSIHRVSIISLAARNHVPAVYFSNYFAKDGGLLSYGVDNADMFRRAASYVDRILHGAKPTDLPVQLPVKFEMAVNVKTAQALSLTVPQTLLLAADEVIQ